MSLMNTMKKAICIAMLTIIYSATSHPMQGSDIEKKQPITVTGEVEEVHLGNENSAWVSIEASVALRFINHGSQPILIFVNDPWPWLGDEYLSSSQENSSLGKYLHSSSVWPSSDRSEWEPIRLKLDQSSPPGEYIHTIPAGDTWRHEVKISLMIEKSVRWDERNKPWNEIKAIDPLWIKLRFLMWPNNLEQDPTFPRFGEKLQKRWQRSGLLVIDNICSEPMPLSLRVH